MQLRYVGLAALALLFGLLCGIEGAQAADIPGSKDLAFLKRYEGSEIIAYQTIPYDRAEIAGPDEQKTPTNWKMREVEGQVTRILYVIPAGHGALEILRNYQQALTEAGFTQTFELSHGINWDGPFLFEHVYITSKGIPGLAGNPFNTGRRATHYTAATGQKDGKDITLGIVVVEYGGPMKFELAGGKKVETQTGQVAVLVDAIAAKAVDNKMVEVKASDMADALATKGSVDLYGIYFDTDKTDIKPESGKMLDEVASLLKIDRSLKLEIAGHTDNTGSKDHNLQLSEGRAKSVVDALVKKYNVDAARLQAKGYGDTKPIAANDTADGKAKNRRVELRKI
jgi:OmpA-OmpF porin, OOP family